MQDLTEEKLRQLENKALQIRRLLIKTLTEAKSGHTAGSLGMADVFTSMYFHILNHNPKKPDWEERDRLVLSNGHICPVQYVALALSGYFPVGELETLRRLNSRLQGHPHRTSLPGIETTSGPLGEGLGEAIGIALTGGLDNKKHYVYCLTSDGEHDEGSTWEAIMFAAKHKLNNLIEIVDRNNIQIGGNTEKVMPLNTLREKYESFNWAVLEINGNSIVEIIESIRRAKTIENKPVVIIAHTIPGKGVSFMENDYKWHGKTPSPIEMEKALKELDKLEIRN
ncbi:transketolase [Patescibacteria group bacterium]|nr:transketolase [Patescibacteria group bacterium]